jgi:hypothetical protein
MQSQPQDTGRAIAVGSRWIYVADDHELYVIDAPSDVILSTLPCKDVVLGGVKKDQLGVITKTGLVKFFTVSSQGRLSLLGEYQLSEMPDPVCIALNGQSIAAIAAGETIVTVSSAGIQRTKHLHVFAPDRETLITDITFLESGKLVVRGSNTYRVMTP